jgi:hypothetical protein
MSKDAISDTSLELSTNLLDEFEFAPTDVERQHQFQEILKSVMPKLGTDENKIILAEVLIALKLEGIIGNGMTEKDGKMVRVLHEAIIQTPEKRKKALRLAYRMLR